MLNRIKIFRISLFAFLIAFHYALIIYVSSTFLGDLLGKDNIWIFYSTGSLFALILNFSMHSILSAIDINKAIRYTLVLELLNLILIFRAQNSSAIALLFIMFITYTSFLFSLASISLEEFSRNSDTGKIRGNYQIISSLGYFLAPFISSFLIRFFSYKAIFLVSSFLIVCTYILFVYGIEKIPRISSPKSTLRNSLKNIFSNFDIKGINISELGLSAFYGAVVIYMPFKIQTVGIPLTTYLSVILPICLLPFLFMPSILGHLEDEFRDEKEVLQFGYIGLIISLFLFGYTTSSSIFVWAVLLFFSRVCAASIEISNASYLFKKINAGETTLISIFQSSQFIAFLFFTPIYALIVNLTDINILFYSIAFCLSFVLVLVSKIHDTKNYHKHEKFKAVWKEIWQKSRKRSKERT